MTFIANHPWLVPLVFTILWLGICWWLLNVMTGGLMFQFVGTLVVVGTGFIWLVYGAWRWLIYLLGIWTLRD